jgi:putative spermidine/putrescine transport system permease protein
MRRLTPYLLLAPAGLVLGAFFAYPLLKLLALSFYVQGALGAELHLSLGNYARFVTDPFYLSVLARTLRVAALVTLACLVLGYPAALDLARNRRHAGLLTILVVLPLTVSIVVRGIAWVMLTSPAGTLATLARAVGLPPGPFQLLYRETAIVLGLTNVLLPFMILSLQGALDQIDPALERAAADLGAGPFRTLAAVTLPLSLPGVGAGCVIVFTLAASYFLIPAMLGGERVRVLSGITYDQGIVLLNLPFASASAVLLFVVVMGIVLAYQWLVDSPRSLAVLEEKA